MHLSRHHKLTLDRCIEAQTKQGDMEYLKPVVFKNLQVDQYMSTYMDDIKKDV